ncbi:MAG: hypothetical protein IPK62_01150 [Bacteroidetes bacterium]|nr:hypothetical protein [Bacteroidota bacterium]MBK8143681.1 hypothetical protein [Bacteroidota bacterium]MBP6315305.1 hypothetical protein [Chitinophagaceae bacterium]
MKKYPILLLAVFLAVQVSSCASTKKKNASATSQSNTESSSKKERSKDDQKKTLTDEIEGTNVPRVKSDKGPTEDVRTRTAPRMLENK